MRLMFVPALYEGLSKAAQFNMFGEGQQVGKRKLGEVREMIPLASATGSLFAATAAGGAEALKAQHGLWHQRTRVHPDQHNVKQLLSDLAATRTGPRARPEAEAMILDHLDHIRTHHSDLVAGKTWDTRALSAKPRGQQPSGESWNKGGQGALLHGVSRPSGQQAMGLEAQMHKALSFQFSDPRPDYTGMKFKVAGAEHEVIGPHPTSAQHLLVGPTGGDTSKYRPKQAMHADTFAQHMGGWGAVAQAKAGRVGAAPIAAPSVPLAKSQGANVADNTHGMALDVADHRAHLAHHIARMRVLKAAADKESGPSAAMEELRFLALHAADHRDAANGARYKATGIGQTLAGLHLQLVKAYPSLR